jgi:ribosomal protein S18 acetylase RimI-like enzyme
MGKTGGEGMKEPRAYRDEHDLTAMQAVLERGRAVDNGSYYIHTGDLKWWLYYPPLEGDFWRHVHLWDDPDQPGRLFGWALISPDWVGIDVYVQPELQGCETAREMYLWAEGEAARVARERGRKAIHVLWVRRDDEILMKHFTQQGFQLGRGSVQLTRSLEGALPAPVLPDGFTLRGCLGLEEVSARATAQFKAFESTAPFGRYLERFTRFMRSPVYRAEQDIVAVAANGQVGAFCIVWTDLLNKVGLFEPVGTQPDFQRRGLGKAVMLEGMRRLQEGGMQRAIVSTGEDNLPAIGLYEALSFQRAMTLGTYEKDV